MRALIFRWSQRIWQSSLLFGAFAAVVRTGSQIFLIPTVLTHLNTSEQAMWGVFAAMGNFSTLADFGFGTAITRVYSYFWAGAEDFDAEGLQGTIIDKRAPNLARVHTLNRTLQYFYTRVTLFATPLFGICGGIYLYKAISETAHPERVWLLWIFYVAAMGLTLATTHWLTACQGIDRVRSVQVSYLTGAMVYFVVAISLLWLGAGLLAMVAATFVRAAVYWYLGKSIFARAVATSTGGEPDLSLLRRIWPGASKFGILSVGALLISNGNVLIGRYLLGTEMTASVWLTGRAGDLVTNVSGLWLQVKWPQITMLRAQGRLKEMAVLFGRRLALVMASFVVLAALVAVAGNAFLAWIHTHTRLIPLPVLIVFFLYLWQQVFYAQFATLVYTENVVPFFRLSLCVGVGVILLSLIMTWLWGLWGLILAPLIVETSCMAWYVVRRGFSSQPLNVRQFARAAISGKISPG